MKQIQQHYKDYKNRQLHQIHVSYNFTKKDGSYGFGRTNLTIKKKVTLEEIESHIKNKEGFNGVVVLSWQPSKISN